MSAAAKVAQAVVWLREGRAEQAEALCTEVIREQPRHAEALQLLGIVALRRGSSEAGIEFLRASLQVNPKNALAHANLGNALCEIKQASEALDSYRSALVLAPQFAGAWYSQGNALMDLKRCGEALASFDRAIALQPHFAEAHNNRGNSLAALGDPEKALGSYRRAIEQRPQFAVAIGNCAKILMDLKRYAESLTLYDRLVGLEPADARAFCNRAHCLMRVDRERDALTSYDRSISLNPNDVEALYGRGTALRLQKKYSEALDDFDRALALAPNSVDILYRRAEALRDLHRFAEAADAFAQVLRLAPERDFALGNLLHARLQVCDWTDYDENVDAALQAVDAGKRVYLPGPFFSVAHSARAQWQCAQIFAARKQRAERSPLWAGEVYPHDKIRIAYVSADFREHPVSVLLVGVLEHHDRGRFEVVGISLSPEQATPLGQRVKSAFDRFIDVSGRTDGEVAALLRELEIDIAVDLMGLTGSGRPEIFAHRPAPLQVNYLGYTGTTASPDLDYMIADTSVIPPAEQRYYTEQVVYMPESYQPSDGRRGMAAATPTRGECGLPQRGFVFCCFNTHYKISPTLFAVWMHLLREVPGSVLWLSAGSADVVRNLRSAALRHDVAPERLVFAARLADAEQYLARFRLADLFLDTLPFNAHATASDALWAGVPVLTCRGASFAGRVAASLLTAIGLPELITDDVQAYQAYALRLAATPALLAALRARMLHNRSTHALFATARYTAHLETAFSIMLDTCRRGEPPLGFTVSTLPVS